MNFWEKLPKPFSVLAPMEDVTDTVFRQIVLKAGRPDVFFTEFTSVDGICSKGFEKVAQRLNFASLERPVVAQIWGNKPELFLQTAKIVLEMGFDGIDINMGCPDRAVLKQGCGAALANKEHRSLVREIISATKQGAGGLPISVKTRLGDRKREEGWIEFLLEQDLAALTVHGRTAKEMSLVAADWEAIKSVVELRDLMFQSHVLDSRKRGPAARVRFETSASHKTLVIGNGDIKSLDDPRIADSDVDGVMIGRGIFENPWVFAKRMGSKEERLNLLKDHLKLWQETWSEAKNYAIMKKFFKMYVRDFDGAGELRAKLMETSNTSDAVQLLDYDR